MTGEPIDVAGFVAQLADDVTVARELAGLASSGRAPSKSGHRSTLDRVVARALVALLECQLRGLNVLADGDQYEAALYEQLGELELQEPIRDRDQ